MEYASETANVWLQMSKIEIGIVVEAWGEPSDIVCCIHHSDIINFSMHYTNTHTHTQCRTWTPWKSMNTILIVGSLPRYYLFQLKMRFKWRNIQGINQFRLIYSHVWTRGQPHAILYMLVAFFNSFIVIFCGVSETLFLEMLFKVLWLGTCCVLALRLNFSIVFAVILLENMWTGQIFFW